MSVYAKICQVLYEKDAEVHYIFPFTFHIGTTSNYSIIEIEKTY